MRFSLGKRVQHLLVKKKIGPFSGGVGPFPRKGFGSNEEGEGRSFGRNVSGSSEDSLESKRRGMLRRDVMSYNGSEMYGEGSLGSSRFGQNGEFEGGMSRKFDEIPVNNSFGRKVEFQGEKRRNFEGILGENSFGWNGEVEGEKRMNFDGIPENNSFGKKVEFQGEKRKNFEGILGKNSCGWNGEVEGEKRRKFEGILGNNRYDQNGKFEGERRRKFEGNLENNSSGGNGEFEGEKRRKFEGNLGNHRFGGNGEFEGEGRRKFDDVELAENAGMYGKKTRKDDIENRNDLFLGKNSANEARLPVSLLREKFGVSYDKPIRVQGKSGVLKVMINKSKNAHVLRQFYGKYIEDVDRSGSKKGNSLLMPQKSDIKLQSSLSKRAKNDGSETEDGDSSLKREPKGKPVGSSSKGGKSEDKTPSAETTIFVTCKETKVKRGAGAEKQLLREEIKHKLLTAGWTINYKPRKNRGYSDAAYINPAGKSYRSIIKAYEAFKKQMGEEVPKELFNKLTRKTRKKTEKDTKMKQRKNAIDKDSAKEEAEEDADDGNNDEKPSADTSSSMIQERKTQKVGRCTLLVRGSDKGSKSQNDDYVPYMGKRTLLSWLIDSGTVNESAKVEYMDRKRNKALLKGWIGRNGIQCNCCSKILTVSKFEIHAGSKLRQPFQNIYLENGFSLLQCLIETWNKQDEAKRRGFINLNIDDVDENDDACGLCGDGGNLMCCDGCPSTFHQSCIGILTLPVGDWLCPNCTCKFCERSSAQGNALLTCRLCERKYHESCKEEIDVLSADVDATFCGKNCQEVFNQLQKLIAVKHELEAGFSWSVLHRTDIDTDIREHGFPQKLECNARLAVALSVIEECFLPITDRRSGINLIHNVLYNRGSNYSRLNHSGFYTAILERGDEIIAAASIRIHGTQLAEMPFIGTRHVYRRQGMCRMLLCAIESALSSLKVGKIVIPAIAEDMHTWREVFDFNPLEESHKNEMRSLNMLVFPGTDLLQKILAEQNTI